MHENKLNNMSKNYLFLCVIINSIMWNNVTVLIFELN